MDVQNEATYARWTQQREARETQGLAPRSEPGYDGVESAGGAPLQAVAEGHRQQAEGSEQRSNSAAHKAELRYDSAERRTAAAQAMEDQGIPPEVVATRTHADTAMGTPATLAATRVGSKSRAPKARKTLSRGAEIERASQER